MKNSFKQRKFSLFIISFVLLFGFAMSACGTKSGSELSQQIPFESSVSTESLPPPIDKNLEEALFVLTEHLVQNTFDAKRLETDNTAPLTDDEILNFVLGLALYMENEAHPFKNCVYIEESDNTFVYLLSDVQPMVAQFFGIEEWYNDISWLFCPNVNGYRVQSSYEFHNSFYEIQQTEVSHGAAQDTYIVDTLIKTQNGEECSIVMHFAARQDGEGIAISYMGFGTANSQ